MIDRPTLEAMATRWEADLAVLPPDSHAYDSLAIAIFDLRKEIMDMEDET